MLFGRKIIALCTARVYDAGHHRFIRVLNDNLTKFNYRLFIYTLNTDLYWNEEETCAEKKVYDLIPYDKIDGVIIMDEKINILPLIVHYKAGSWVEDAKKHDGYKPISIEAWLEKNKKYWFTKDSKNEKEYFNNTL